MIYEYTNISTSPNLDKISYEVAGSPMTDKSMESGSWREDTQILELYFTNALSGEDKTILDAIVAGHTIAFPEMDFNIEQFLARFKEEFPALSRHALAKKAPSFLAEMQFRNFDAIKAIRDYLLSTEEITQTQADKITGLFTEQNINLDNY